MSRSNSFAAGRDTNPMRNRPPSASGPNSVYSGVWGLLLQVIRDAAIPYCMLYATFARVSWGLSISGRSGTFAFPFPSAPTQNGLPLSV